MAYRGRYSLGDFIPLQIQTKDANGVPTVPDRAPEARIFTPGGALNGHFSLPIQDRYTVRGLFQRLLPATSFFNAVGNWRVVYTWQIGAYNGMDEDTFDVTPGGSNQGNVISAFFYKRPNADYIVYQTDGGVITGEATAGLIIGGRTPQI